MVRQNTIDRMIKYAKKIPDLDPELIGEGMLLFHLHREIERLSETYVAKRYGLSVRQMDTLEALFHKQNEFITPAQLSEEIHLTRSAMTSNLDSLERKEYVSRMAHPKDRRMIVINMTPKGIELCKKIMPARYQDMIKVMKCFSREERESIRFFYSKMVQILGEMLMEARK